MRRNPSLLGVIFNRETCPLFPHKKHISVIKVVFSSSRYANMTELHRQRPWTSTLRNVHLLTHSDSTWRECVVCRTGARLILPLFLAVMRRGGWPAYSGPLWWRRWAGILWWLPINGELLQPPGWELAGCEVCPDGVSSAPLAHPPTPQLHTCGFNAHNEVSEEAWPSSPGVPNKDERRLLHQNCSLIGGQLRRDPSLTFRVCLMARDGKVRFQMSGVELNTRDAARDRRGNTNG